MHVDCRLRRNLHDRARQNNARPILTGCFSIDLPRLARWHGACWLRLPARSRRCVQPKENAMRVALITTAIASALMLAACNQPDTPQENRERVAEARQEAQRDVAEARQEASRAEAEARRDVQQAEHEARDELRPVQAEAVRESAQARHDVAVAEAEAKHRVETEKCRVLEANAR